MSASIEDRFAVHRAAAEGRTYEAGPAGYPWLLAVRPLSPGLADVEYLNPRHPLWGGGHGVRVEARP